MASTGRVYLVASGQDESLDKVAARALAETGARRPRVAISYAPIAESPQALGFMQMRASTVFAGADVERFAVEGEEGAMDTAAARAVVERADLVFLVGGDPVLGAKILKRAGAGEWLRAAHARGASMLGVSAGSILLGAWWAEWSEEDAAAGANGLLVECLRVVGDLVIDCHDEASDWEELRLVKAMYDASAGGARTRERTPARFVGIPTGGAIVVHPDGGRATHEIVGNAPLYLT
jgi:cyanophycinase-like exopeptidase